MGKRVEMVRQGRSAELSRSPHYPERSRGIELFDNPRPGRDYCITIRCPEFTSVCPRTRQPDFGEIVIEYCPDKLCIELKSLKLYMQGYRNKGIFYETLTNDILDDLVGACKPRWMKVTSRFTPRGGITTEVVAEQKAQT